MQSKKIRFSFICANVLFFLSFFLFMPSDEAFFIREMPNTAIHISIMHTKNKWISYVILKKETIRLINEPLKVPIQKKPCNVDNKCLFILFCIAQHSIFPAISNKPLPKPIKNKPMKAIYCFGKNNTVTSTSNPEITLIAPIHIVNRT